MHAERFEALLDAQLTRVREVLGSKAGEYAGDTDRLENFRRAADLTNDSMPRALRGMMLKHTISIYMMIEDDQPFPIEVWEEKITDHINYLILLRAVLEDNAQGAT